MKDPSLRKKYIRGDYHNFNKLTLAGGLAGNFVVELLMVGLKTVVLESHIASLAGVLLTRCLPLFLQPRVWGRKN